MGGLEGGERDGVLDQNPGDGDTSAIFELDGDADGVADFADWLGGEAAGGEVFGPGAGEEASEQEHAAEDIHGKDEEVQVE